MKEKLQTVLGYTLLFAIASALYGILYMLVMLWVRFGEYLVYSLYKLITNRK